MPRIQYSASPVPGVPLENCFQVLDEFGMKTGSASVVEFNTALLPDRPQNYYLTITANDERTFHMLLGATYARTMVLLRSAQEQPARMYVSCPPGNNQLLSNLLECGFENDDAIVRKRLMLSETDKYSRPPVGTAIAPVLLETQEDHDQLLRRLNANTVTAFDYAWIARMQNLQYFSVWGVWQDDRLLGEMALSSNSTEGTVEMIYTRPEFRGKGVASALLGHAASELLHYGVHALCANVWQRNVPATQLFDKHRFETLQPVVLFPGINF